MITITISGKQGSGKLTCADIIKESLSKIRLPYQNDKYKNIVKIFDGVKVPKKFKCDIAIIINQEK